MSYSIAEKNVDQKQSEFNVERAFQDILHMRAFPRHFSLNQLYQIWKKIPFRKYTDFQNQKVFLRVQDQVDRYQSVQTMKQLNQYILRRQLRNQKNEKDQKRQTPYWGSFFSTSFKKLFSGKHSQLYQVVPSSEESPFQTHKTHSSLLETEQQPINVVKDIEKFQSCKKG